MNPPRFYCPNKLSLGHADLPESVAHHVTRVLRMHEGDCLTLFDGQGGEYAASIIAVEKKRVHVEIRQWQPVERESALKITLVQALQSGEKMDMTIQKAVELGVWKIVPVISRRSMLRPVGERAQKKLEHWRGIIAAACEQCGRNRLPEILPIVTMENWLGSSNPSALRLFLDPGAECSFANLSLKPASDACVELLIGAEGGLSPDEEALARVAGFSGIRMGPRVMRTETAALAALCIVQQLWGDLGM